jgi:hypothetical protein
MALSPAHTSWIALIRYQATTAVEQSRQPTPLSTLAINGVQDAVEALLGLVIEHRKISVKGKDFMQYFDAVAGSVPAIASHRNAMVSLNSARVSYKHHHNILERTSVERNRVNALNFLADLATEALGVDFDTVGLTVLIADEAASRHITAADEHWAAGDRQVALAHLRLAFDQLVDSFVERKLTLFDTRPRMKPTGRGLFDDKRMNYAEKWLEALDKRLKLLMLGVDVRRYLYLDAHAPAVWGRFDGQVRITEHHGAPPPADEVFTRCRQFVVDTALELAADDYEFDPWSAREMRSADEPRFVERVIELDT